MRIRIIEACYIDGRRAEVGSEHTVQDTAARNLVSLGRALPVIAKPASPEQTEADRKPKGKR